MCTCISYKNGDNYFGRNLDLEYSFDEKVVITPRNYKFILKNGEEFVQTKSLIGMATVVNNVPLYAEATNEDGLSIAGLNFPGNAYYGEVKEGMINLCPFEIIPYLLSKYSSVREIKEVISKINIVNISFSENMPNAPLHWMISDSHESIVVEPMLDGLKVYDNKIGVLTNNPPFYYHELNLNNYMNLSAEHSANRFASDINLKTYGVGMGAIGLPGDVSPASRFVRAAFNKLNSYSKKDELSNVSQFFHILDSVAMVRGQALTKDGKYDITTYSCCINTLKGVYYYKTYDNNQISAVSMHNENLDSSDLKIYDLILEEQINYIN